MKIKKQDFIKIINDLQEEGVMFFSTEDILNRIGYKNESLSRRLRRILDGLCDKNTLEKISVGKLNVYSITKNHKIRLPFFEKPATIKDTQLFIDKFWDDISGFVSDITGTNSFSLVVNGNSLYALKTTKVLVK